MKRSRTNANRRHSERASDRPWAYDDVRPCNDDSDEESKFFEVGDENDDRWDVFIADDDEIDPLPEVGDFWLEED
jgi:hypothetical protein